MNRLVAVAAIVAAGTTAAMAQLSERPLSAGLTHPAIEYATRPTHDLVAEMDRRIDSGGARLTFDEGSGYLRSVLEALRLPVESQLLVMSKTGVQALHTGPSNPRAIYFNDAVTVGYIRGAPLLEIAVEDPEQGVIFYTIDQKPQARAIVERRQSCLTCHRVYSTLHVPGMLARSVFMAPDGSALGQFGSYDADDRTPFRRRWGGWYVTGADGAMAHLGNAVVTDREKRETIVSDDTVHRISVDELFDARTYPSAHSDIAALMVFQHQSHMTNLITRVGWEARLGGSLRETVNELVDYLLFVDEQPLPAAIKGGSGFTEKFSAQGPADRRGRSLRQLDLEHRLLRYPCSYMIYSAVFAALPADVRGAIYVRMWHVLSGREAGARYARLPEFDRRAIVEILRETLPDLPDEFHASGDRVDLALSSPGRIQ